jgi:hypothetical protein
MFEAIRELIYTLHTAWRAADLPRRLRIWWRVATNQDYWHQNLRNSNET